MPCSRWSRPWRRAMVVAWSRPPALQRTTVAPEEANADRTSVANGRRLDPDGGRGPVGGSPAGRMPVPELGEDAEEQREHRVTGQPGELGVEQIGAGGIVIGPLAAPPDRRLELCRDRRIV